MTTIPNLAIDGNAARLTFNRFDIDAYHLFLKAKALPEKSVVYDFDTDTYTLTTHRRFAPRLTGTPDARLTSAMLPMSAFLWDYQRYICARAVEAERFACFADTGLGKSLMEMECARQVLHIAGGKFLHLTFPWIVGQFAEMQAQFYPEMPLTILSTRDSLVAWLTDGKPGAAIAGYPKLIGGVIPEFRNLNGLSCDESRVLKTAGGVIKWNLIKSAKGIPYKFCFSATPAPNDVMEYASQASLLEKIQGFWQYFSKAGDQKGDWYIKPHAKAAFYEMMSSWSIALRNPARFGFEDRLGAIPPPVYHDHMIEATGEQRDFAMGVFARAGSGMFGDRSLGVTWRTKLSEAGKGFVYDKDAPGGVRPISSNKPAFVAKLIYRCLETNVMDPMSGHKSVLVWTVFDEESRLIAEHLDKCGWHKYRILTGKMKDDEQSSALEDFRTGRVPILISKAQMIGFGLNLQFVTSMIFSGWDDSYERYYQAVRRAVRCGQTRPVHIHMPIVADLEGPIVENLMRKRASFDADAKAQEDAFLNCYRDDVQAFLARQEPLGDTR